MILVEQIIALLVVYFQIAHVQFVHVSLRSTVHGIKHELFNQSLLSEPEGLFLSIDKSLLMLNVPAPLIV